MPGCATRGAGHRPSAANAPVAGRACPPPTPIVISTRRRQARAEQSLPFGASGFDSRHQQALSFRAGPQGRVEKSLPFGRGAVPRERFPRCVSLRARACPERRRGGRNDTPCQGCPTRPPMPWLCPTRPPMPWLCPTSPGIRSPGLPGRAGTGKRPSWFFGVLGYKARGCRAALGAMDRALGPLRRGKGQAPPARRGGRRVARAAPTPSAGAA
jgi:hypothetical protein